MTRKCGPREGLDENRDEGDEADRAHQKAEGSSQPERHRGIDQHAGPKPDQRPKRVTTFASGARIVANCDDPDVLRYLKDQRIDVGEGVIALADFIADEPQDAAEAGKVEPFRLVDAPNGETIC